MRIGIFGGTFNPPHTGHVAAVCRVREALKLDRVLVVPSCVPPHKRLPAGTPPASARLEMTRLSFEDLPFVSVSPVEIERGGVSFTSDTLADIEKAYPGAKLWFIAGTDMLLTMERWHRPEVLFSLCRIAVIARAEAEAEVLRHHAELLSRKYGAAVDVVEAEPVDISSSRLRGMLSRGKGAAYLVPRVCAYIAEKGYYRPVGSGDCAGDEDGT